METQRINPGSDAVAIATSVKSRGIRSIWHLTQITSLPSIFNSGGLICRAKLDEAGIDYEMSGWGTPGKEEEFKNYISCSIVSPWGMANKGSEAKALVTLKSVVLQFEGVLFCGIWSSFNEVSLDTMQDNTTVEAFNLMFDNPTSPFPSPVPGEILVPYFIPLAAFTGPIYLSNEESRETAIALCKENNSSVEDSGDSEFNFLISPYRFGLGNL